MIKPWQKPHRLVLFLNAYFILWKTREGTDPCEQTLKVQLNINQAAIITLTRARKGLSDTYERK